MSDHLPAPPSSPPPPLTARLRSGIARVAEVAGPVVVIGGVTWAIRAALPAPRRDHTTDTDDTPGAR